MSSVVGYQLDDDTVVRFEYDPEPGFDQAGPQEIVGQLREAIEPALAGAQLVMDRARSMSPDEVEVKFGLKVSGQMNWWVAKAATDGNFEVTLKWKPGGEE